MFFIVYLKLAPEIAEFQDTLGWAYLSADRLSLASAAFRQAIKLKPEYQSAYYHLGLTLAKQGHNKQAIVQLEKAVSLDNKSEDAKLAKAKLAELQH